MVVEDAPFGIVSAALVERWGAQTLAAAGVLDGFALVDDTDVVVDADEIDHQLDAEDLWLDAVLDQLPESDLPPTLVELTAVRDLELVRADAWPQALALLASPAYRGRVVEPAWVLLPDGHRVGVPSYTAWWLSRYARLDGRPLGSLRLDSADDLDGLLDPVGLPLDDRFLQAVGVRASLEDLLSGRFDGRPADDHGGAGRWSRGGDPRPGLRRRSLTTAVLPSRRTGCRPGSPARRWLWTQAPLSSWTPRTCCHCWDRAPCCRSMPTPLLTWP